MQNSSASWESQARYAPVALPRDLSERWHVLGPAAARLRDLLGRLAVVTAIALAVCLASALILKTVVAEHFTQNRWESTISAFEALDQENPPSKGAVLFVGSSSIKLWRTLETDFPFTRVINRGFGGSTIEDLLFFADRIIIPYAPRQVVLYSGDNDIARGYPPERVFNDFRALVERIQIALPETRIVFISIKPSLARWEKVDEIRKANGLIQQYARKNEKLAYIDVFSPMIGSDGMPRADLLLSDQLHMNSKGYELWTRAVAPHLDPVLNGRRSARLQTVRLERQARFFPPHQSLPEYVY